MESVALGCAPDCLPFLHLGVLVGQCMSRVSAWSLIVDHFRSRLSDWKAKFLSFGGRLTLIKSVHGSLGSYLVSIFLVPISVPNSLEAFRAFFWGRSWMTDVYIGSDGIEFWLVGKKGVLELVVFSASTGLCSSVGGDVFFIT